MDTASVSQSSSFQHRSRTVEFNGEVQIQEHEVEGGVVWIVPRWLMCLLFWCGDFLLFGGIILLVTSQYKGLLFEILGYVTLALGCCLLLLYSIFCIYTYCCLRADVEQKPKRVKVSQGTVTSCTKPAPLPTTSFVDALSLPPPSFDHVISVTQGNTTLYLGDKNAPALTPNGTLVKSANGSLKVKAVNNRIIDKDVMVSNDNVVNYPDLAGQRSAAGLTTSHSINSIRKPVTPLTVHKNANSVTSSTQQPPPVIAYTVDNESSTNAVPQQQQQQLNTHYSNGSLSQQSDLKFQKVKRPDIVPPAHSNNAMFATKSNTVHTIAQINKSPVSAFKKFIADNAANDSGISSNDESIRMRSPLLVYQRGGQDSFSSDSTSITADDRQKFNNNSVLNVKPSSSAFVALSNHARRDDWQGSPVSQPEEAGLRKKAPPIYSDAIKWDSLSLSESDVAQSPPTPPPFCSKINSNNNNNNRIQSTKSPTCLGLPAQPTAQSMNVDYYDYSNVGSRLASQAVVVNSKHSAPPPYGMSSSYSNGNQDNGAGPTGEHLLGNIDEEDWWMGDKEDGEDDEEKDTNNARYNRSSTSNGHDRGQHNHQKVKVNGSANGYISNDYNNESLTKNVHQIPSLNNSSHATRYHANNGTGNNKKYQRYVHKFEENENVTSSKASVYDNVSSRPSAAKPRAQQFSF